MSDAKPGRIVELGSVLLPSSSVRLMPPAERTDVPREPEPAHRGTRGGLMFMLILGMSPEERRRVAGDAAAVDPSVVWFAMLTPAERAEFIKAAEHDLKERFGG